MKHWTDYLFAARHPLAFIGWLGYRQACWEGGWGGGQSYPARYFRPWAEDWLRDKAQARIRRRDGRYTD